MNYIKMLLIFIAIPLFVYQMILLVSVYYDLWKMQKMKKIKVHTVYNWPTYKDKMNYLKYFHNTYIKPCQKDLITLKNEYKKLKRELK